MVKFYAITGPMGIGKTTLLKQLLLKADTDKYNVELIFNSLHDSKFFEYHRLDSLGRFTFQLYALLDAYHDFRKVTNASGHTILLSDYSYYENTIYRQTLTNLKLMTKEQDAHSLATYLMYEKYIPEPDMLIFIKASDDFIMNNLVNRGRAPEIAKMRDLEIYVNELNKNFTSFMDAYSIRNPTKSLILRPHEIPTWLAQIKDLNQVAHWKSIDVPRVVVP